MEASKTSLRGVGFDKLHELAESRPYMIQILQTQLLYDIASMIDEIRGESRRRLSEQRK